MTEKYIAECKDNAHNTRNINERTEEKGNDVMSQRAFKQRLRKELVPCALNLEERKGRKVKHSERSLTTKEHYVGEHR